MNEGNSKGSVKSPYMKTTYITTASSCAVMLIYEEHPILVELHRQVDNLYDPAFDGTLYETLFLVNSTPGSSRDQGKILDVCY